MIYTLSDDAYGLICYPIEINFWECKARCIAYKKMAHLKYTVNQNFLQLKICKTYNVEWFRLRAYDLNVSPIT